jgi:signal transduction histidine kinase
MDWFLRRDVSPNLPIGHGDERRLAQVLLNLVGNAIKFMDKGEVAIKATTSDGSFTVAVRDTGPGIAAVDQGKISRSSSRRIIPPHHRDARRPHLGRVGYRQRFDVRLYHPGDGRTTGW